MGHFTRTSKESLFGAAIGLASFSACTRTELALGRNDAANPLAATAPLAARARLSSSSDAPPTTSPMPDGHDGAQREVPVGMKLAEASKTEVTAVPAKAAHWTSTMHPSVDFPKPGKCPICGMELVPKTDDAGDGAAK